MVGGSNETATAEEVLIGGVVWLNFWAFFRWVGIRFLFFVFWVFF